jgi:hypothetical protein
MNINSSSGKVGLQRLLAPVGSSSGNENEDGEGSSSNATSGGFLRVTPLAGVNLMSQQGMPAAAGVGSSSSSSNDGRPRSPVRLTGAVAAIFRMQEAFQQSVSSSVANLTSLGSSNGNSSSSSVGNTFLGAIGDRIGGMMPQLPNDVGQAVQGSLARISPPWSGLLPNNNTSSGSGSRDTAGQDQRQQQQQQRRRPLPTAAIIIADTLTSPSVTPPYPLNQILKTQSKGQVQDMLDGLVKAAVAAAAAAGAAQQ